MELNHTSSPRRTRRGPPNGGPSCSDLDPPEHWGPFWQVSTANGVNIDFDERAQPDTIRPLHYAFLITEDDFDTIFGRIVERSIDHYADPSGRRQGEINHNDGGRGVYFPDPDGHWLEIITRPYGSG